MEHPWINNTTFKVKFPNKWFANTDIIGDGLARKMRVLENPYRKWYEVLFQYLTLGFYRASWYYKLQYLENE
jgi:hypothetical protein